MSGAAPLLLTWDAIMIPVHLHIGAVLQEIFGFFTGCHLAAVDTTVTCERRSARRPDIDGGSIDQFGFRAERGFWHGFDSTRMAAILFITLPTQETKY